ncbi:efflux RND transporter periplasmic adaptor subunit [Idiomarina sp. PL1-037]|uniref:efflux RND transporter periplasmic adaptor subunit n=1 Tax=Idiomarina TaxID=135575 RepID=UPI00294B08A3|nr:MULTISPECIES: efflux RND transporter periplasmic adaptor subunit [unclassified Idiomarina]MDV6327968.1 efflux RND transporter periplasmic adaptor subunit [Idiomarina sp. Sol25]WQC53433.1 efflux RND transporter periplasmic adaptor subunit [Idiomarina sp. PL1-037]
MRWLKPFSIALVAVVMAACSEQAQVNDTQQARPARLMQVTEADGPRLREFPAVVEAAKVAQLTFRVAGEIIELPGRPGTEVKKGDLIARLDPTDYQLAVNQAKAQYELALSQYERNKVLVNQGVMSEGQFDQIESQLAVAKSNYETAKANLRYTKLTAPFDGVIAKLAVENYENIQPKQPIVVLQISNALDISINVPENIFAKVKRQADYQPEVRFDAAPDSTYPAHLKEWNSQSDRATNAYEVIFTLPKPEDINLLPGMTATVIVDINEVLRSSNIGMVVPSKAVFTDTDDVAYVWVVDDNMRVQKRKVVIGPMTNEGLTLLNGLKPGEKIVTAGVHQLEENQQVREWQRERGL